MVMKRLQADFDSDWDMSKLNNRIKNEPLNTNESLEELLKSKKFNLKQKTQAKQGLRKGLTEEQVLFYFRPEFSSEQMEQAQFGFQSKLTEEQVSTFYKIEYSAHRMATIRWVYQDFRKPENRLEFLLSFQDENDDVLREIFYGMRLRYVTDENIRFLLEKDLTVNQIQKGISGFHAELTEEEVENLL